MSELIAAGDYTRILAREYFDTFVPAGGAAVKFVVACGSETTAQLARAVGKAATAAGLVVAALDAADTRIHMIDKLFNRIAEQVPWATLAEQRLRALAAPTFQVPERWSRRGIAVQVAERAGVDPGYVRTVLEKAIAAEVFNNHRLARDFRFAMTWACRARLAGEVGADRTFDDLDAWLCGRLRSVSNLRPYGIYTRINRTNARHHLGSLFTWVRQCGGKGTAIVIDAARLTLGRQPDGVNYTRASRLDAYEVLREFIDDTDQLEGALVVVVLNREFLETLPGSNGLGAYPALMNRVYDEVRDRNHANPMAALVRIGCAGGAGGAAKGGGA